MNHSLIKIAAIAFNFFAFVIIVDALQVHHAAVFLLALSFVSLTAPILEFGYSRFVFSKMARGLSPSVALTRVLSRMIASSPFAILASIVFSIFNEIPLTLLLIILFFGATPLPISIFRYFYILNGRHSTSVLIEAIQPTTFFLISICAITMIDIPINLEIITGIYCFSHSLSFLVAAKSTPKVFLNPLPRRVFFFRNSLGHLKLYTSTLGISFEQFAFSFWLFFPIVFFGHIGNSEAVVEMSVLQKILSLVVAMYSIYSVKRMHLMANGKLCYWGNKYTIMAIAAAYAVGIALEVGNTLISTLSIKSEFVKITESLISYKIMPPALFMALFSFLHIQAYLLHQSKIKWRLLNSITLVLTQAILIPLAYIKGIDKISVMFTSLFIVIAAFLVVRHRQIKVIHE